MGARKDYITHGPWGGSQGKEWIYKPEGSIRKISVRHGGLVDSIKFQSFNAGETQVSFFGGKGGTRTDTICVDYPDEYLTSITGTILYSHDGSGVVNSICFITNENSYGPYGTDKGTPFSYDGKGGVIVGFHGRVDKYLTSIGVFVMPESLAFSQSSTFGQTYINQSKIMYELSSSMNRMALPRNTGPWGVSGGTPWDDGVFSTVKKVHVHLGELITPRDNGTISTVIAYAIQFEYLKRDGKPVLSPIRGQAGASRVEVIHFGDKDEYLSGISGFYGPVKWLDGVEAIRSISFHTNKRKYGPYGEAEGPKMYGPDGEEKGPGTQMFSSFSASPGKVVGFHGWSDGFLTKIGVHMEYF